MTAVTENPWHLLPHPQSLTRPAAELAVSLAWLGDGLTLGYRYTWRDVSAQALQPPAAPAGPADGLWKTTCFELFIGDPATPAYREFNLAPDGRHAHYAFVRRRERDPAGAPDAPWPSIRVEAEPGSLAVTALLPRAALPQRLDGPLGLSAVIDHGGGQLTYWALHHPGERPDFHDRRGWTARLPHPTVPR